MSVLDVGQLFSEYGPAIRGYLLRRVQDAELADDLAQQVWLTVHRYDDRYADQGKPVLAWLYRVAARVLADHYRQQQRRLPMVSLDGVGSGEPTTTDAGSGLHDDQLDAASTAGWALAQATPEQVAVLRCRVFERLSIIETSRALGIRQEAVKKAQFRALARMRRALDARAS